MKNLLSIAIATLLFVATTNAQETTQLVSKKGVPILPQAGDYSIGVDATPFINYFGNLANGGWGNNEGAGFQTTMPNAITGKYFLSDKTALRAMFRFGMTSDKHKNLVADAAALFIDPNSEAEVEDVSKYSETNISIGLGLEKRRGAGRVQGVYGAMLDFGIESSKTTYEYGNALTVNTPNPTRTIYDFDINNPQWQVSNDLRESKPGSTFTIGLNGFVGVEYFFAPKMSLGGEFMYGLSYMSTGEGVIKTESWNFGDNAIETTETKIAGNSFFGLDTNIGGSIYLNFYF
jgi:hypothetical protein